MMDRRTFFSRSQCVLVLVGFGRRIWTSDGRFGAASSGAGEVYRRMCLAFGFGGADVPQP